MWISQHLLHSLPVWVSTLFSYDMKFSFKMFEEVLMIFHIHWIPILYVDVPQPIASGAAKTRSKQTVKQHSSHWTSLSDHLTCQLTILSTAEIFKTFYVEARPRVEIIPSSQYCCSRGASPQAHSVVKSCLLAECRRREE